MSDEKFKEMAEFEAEHDCTVISPNLLGKLAGMEEIVKERNKQKQHFFYVVLQDREGKIANIAHYSDYEIALMRGMEKSKETGTYWSIFDLGGRFIDGNFVG